MTTGLQTCPACGTRVLPTGEEDCPACRAHNFATGATLETPALARRAAFRSEIYRGAVTHWVLIAFVAGQLVLAVIDIASRVVPGLPSRLGMTSLVWAFASLVVVLGTIISARRLARWLGLTPWLWVVGLLIPVVSLFVLLKLMKTSVLAFEPEGIRVRTLGPDLEDARRASGLAE